MNTSDFDSPFRSLHLACHASRLQMAAVDLRPQIMLLILIKLADLLHSQRSSRLIYASSSHRRVACGRLATSEGVAVRFEDAGGTCGRSDARRARDRQAVVLRLESWLIDRRSGVGEAREGSEERGHAACGGELGCLCVCGFPCGGFRLTDLPKGEVSARESCACMRTRRTRGYVTLHVFCPTSREERASKPYYHSLAFISQIRVKLAVSRMQVAFSERL